MNENVSDEQITRSLKMKMVLWRKIKLYAIQNGFRTPSTAIEFVITKFFEDRKKEKLKEQMISKDTIITEWKE